MNRTNESEALVHERVQAQLPWYLNGTLEARRRIETEAHLRRCGECRAELELQRAVAGRVRRGAPVQPAPQASLDRLMARIDREQALRARRGRWRQWLERLAGAARGRVLERAVAVQAGAILLLAALLLWSLTRPEPPAEYRTLGDPAGPTGTAAQLQVLPSDSLTAARLRVLLDTVGGRIVHGPTGDGVYVIELPQAAPGASAEAAAWLEAQPGVERAVALDEPETSR